MPKSRRSSQAVRAVDAALLRRWPLAEPGPDADKEERGRVMIIGGCTEVPGAVLLAGGASLRAGAGKLQISTVRSAAIQVGVAIPEARVIGLDETRNGSIAPSSARAAADSVSGVHATLVGPGMMCDSDIIKFMEKFLSAFGGEGNLVIDAGAIAQLRGRNRLLKKFSGRVVITPHAGEMAGMTGLSITEISRNPGPIAIEVARETGAVVSLKGPDTWIADPEGTLVCYRQGGVGLATSGSGDVLAGIVAGLLARGNEPLVAATWASYVHGAAGRILARRFGRIGFLARELISEIPGVLASRGAG